MINISASTIKDILVCSQRVYFRINYPEEATKTREMILGDVVHKAIERFPYDKDSGDAYIKAELSPNYALATDMYHTYHDSFKSLTKESDLVEQFFKLKISEDVNLVGKMDRVNLEDGIVLDWKTGGTTPSSLSNDIQFILYDYAYKKMYEKTPNLVGLASLRSGKLIRYKENTVLTEQVFSVIIPKVVDTIKSNNYAKEGLFSYTPKGDLSTACTYCSFRRFCLEE